MISAVRVGIIDSGIRPGFGGSVIDARRFKSDNVGRVSVESVKPDRLGHGSAIANLIVDRMPAVELLIAQVFLDLRVAKLAEVIEALKWLLANGAQVINMSFGLSRPDRALHLLCKEMVEDNDVILVASAPARGGIVFPAGFASCIAVTGDIRCGLTELSWLGTSQADFGAHPFLAQNDPTLGGGASYACARVAGWVATALAAGTPPRGILRYLKDSAAYIGPDVRHLVVS